MKLKLENKLKLRAATIYKLTKQSHLDQQHFCSLRSRILFHFVLEVSERRNVYTRPVKIREKGVRSSLA